MSDPHAEGKSNRFVGICIQRGGKGLGATFILRNIINNQGEGCLLSANSFNKDLWVNSQAVASVSHHLSVIKETIIYSPMCAWLRCGDLLRAVQPSYCQHRGAEAGEEAGRQPDVPERRSARLQHRGPGHEGCALPTHWRGASQQGERAVVSVACSTLESQK